VLHRVILRLAPALIILASITLWLGYSEAQKNDPFASYRDFVKKPLNITAPPLVKHYEHEEKLIREKLKLKLSQKERSILAGLHWILGLVDNDEEFAFLFPDFMLFMDKMSDCEDRIHQKEIVNLVIKTSFARAEKQLDKLFKDEDMARWRLIGLLPILLKHPEFISSYTDFYAKKWPNNTQEFKDKNASFSQALKNNNYKALFDYLVWPSFLHYYLAESKNNKILLPNDKFPEYLEEFKKFNYQVHDIRDPGFRDLGYLATHVVLALSNYGLVPLTQSDNSRKVHDYILSSFDKARELGDFDLFAEYIYCLKILEPQKNPGIEKLEQFLYDLQRPDGSWGSEKDFQTNPYTAIHPGGAALMALNQKSF
jgi:hypothetical protein